MRINIVVFLLLFIGCNKQNSSQNTQPRTFHIFQDNMIHFSLIDSIKTQYETVRVGSLDNGREIIAQAE